MLSKKAHALSHAVIGAAVPAGDSQKQTKITKGMLIFRLRKPSGQFYEPHRQGCSLPSRRRLTTSFCPDLLRSCGTSVKGFDRLALTTDYHFRESLEPFALRHFWVSIHPSQHQHELLPEMCRCWIRSSKCAYRAGGTF